MERYCFAHTLLRKVGRLIRKSLKPQDLAKTYAAPKSQNVVLPTNRRFHWHGNRAGKNLFEADTRMDQSTGGQRYETSPSIRNREVHIVFLDRSHLRKPAHKTICFIQFGDSQQYRDHASQRPQQMICVTSAFGES